MIDPATIPSVPMDVRGPVTTELLTSTAQKGQYLARSRCGRALCVRPTPEEARAVGERYIRLGRFE